MVRLGDSELDVFPLSIGGNVFGWTTDRDATFEVLDAYYAGGGNFIDTADSYSAWAPGNKGGESETLVGEWLASRKPSNMIIATKVSQHPDFLGLSPANIRAAAEASLRRLGVDTIDLYYAHFDDPKTPLEETVAAFGDLVDDGLVRYTAVSNYTDERIREWIGYAQAGASAVPVAVQPRYNLVAREIERTVVPVAEEFGLSLVPYSALALGFLSGKYRSTEIAAGASPRAARAVEYATPAGLKVLGTLEEVAANHNATVASTALAWLRSRPTVAAPIAAASRVEQVADLLASTELELSGDEIEALDSVSAPFIES